MDQKLIKSISSQIYRQFPELAGAKPKVRLQPASASSAKQEGKREIYLLTFQTRVEAAPGRSIQRWVRVTSDAQGHILKVSTSH